MNIHRFDRQTKEYIDTISIKKNPDGEFYPPAFSTDVSTGLVTNVINKISVFNGTSWVLTSDYRGLVYDTTTQEQIEYTDLGNLPVNLTTTAPSTGYDKWGGTTWVIDLVKSKQNKLNLIKQLRNTDIYQPINSSALGTIHTYSVTERNNNFLNNLITLGNGSKFTCIDSTGAKIRVLHTDEQLRTLGLDIETHISAQFDKYELKLIEVETATSQVELDTITW